MRLFAKIMFIAEYCMSTSYEINKNSIVAYPINLQKLARKTNFLEIHIEIKKNSLSKC